MNRAGLLCFAWLAGAGSLTAQVASLPVRFPLNAISACHPDQLALSRKLGFQQRSCWYGSKFLSPWVSLRAGFSSGIAQLENNPYKRKQDGDDYASRFGAYYTRRGARGGAEMFTGYFHDEDPRPRLSGEAGYKDRVRSALLSVVLSPGAEGNRPALAPFAGSVASAFAGMACDRPRHDTTYVLERFAASYSAYFGRALYEEFRPDIRFFVTRTLRKFRPGLMPFHFEQKVQLQVTGKIRFL